MWHALALIKKWPLPGDRRGVSALEFGIVGGLLAVLMLGVWDLGNAAQQEIRLQEALHAAGQYALAFPTDTNGIDSTITEALPSGWSDAVVTGPSYSCACWSSSGSSASPSGTAPNCTCPNGLTVEEFVTVGVSRPFTPLLIQALNNISASYVVRYR